tara:strand:- start:1235 stop:2200 length:966 start_codon:yes stop_codon:yes gene_type:complete
MAVTSTIEYCTDRDLQDVYPHIAEYDLKRRLYNWQTTGTSHLYLVRNSGLVTLLFADGEDLGDAEANSGVVDANGEWYYDSNLDTVYYYDSATAPNARVMEAGDDWATIKTRFRRKASRLIESHLDNRMSREVMKDREGNYPEIIVHATALQTVILLLKSHDPNNEIIEPFKNELDEIIDGLKSGSIVLPHSVTSDSSKGVIREVSVNGGSDLRPVELKGNYNVPGYDLIKLKVITGGVIGTSTYSVWVKDSDTLKNEQVITEEKITGDYDHVTSGLYIRFSGDDVSSAVTNANDEYEIEVHSSSIDADMSSIGSVTMTRR